MLFRSETRVIRRVRGCALAVIQWSRKRFFARSNRRGTRGDPARDPALRSRARRASSSGRSRRETRRRVAPRARGRAPPGGSLVQNEDAPPRGTNEARRLIRGRGARKRSARAYPVDGCVPGHGVLVVSVDERHGADSGGVRRARGSAAGARRKSTRLRPNRQKLAGFLWDGRFRLRQHFYYTHPPPPPLHSRYLRSRALAAATSSGSSEFSSTARHTSYLALSLSAEAGEDAAQPHEGTGAGAPTS
jgi:hypothetical protein